nr:unnamed protein product [Callosobruchus chinensis]
MLYWVDYVQLLKRFH